MQIKNSQFLNVVYGNPPDGTHGWVCAFRSDPSDSPAAVWTGRLYKGLPKQSELIDRADDDNAYFCTAVLRATDDGKVARLKSAFEHLAVLLADDVQLSDLKGMPTYVIETSPGKHQAGICIDPLDEDAADADLVDAVMHALAETGRSNDTSGNSRVRYGRLPVGSNTKARPSGVFKARLERWHPDQVLSLDEACSVLGLDLDEIKDQAAAPVQRSEYKPDPDVRSVEGVSEGGRDEAVYKYACSLRARDADYAEAQVLVLHKAAACIPSFPQPEAMKCLQSAWQHPAGKSAEFMLAATPQRETRALFVSASDLIKNVKPPQWIIRDFLEENCLAVIFGDPEAGKSMISIGMACSIAAGHAWMGHEVKRPGAVFYVSGEGYNGVSRRLKAWTIRNRVPMPPSLFLTERPVSISDSQSIAGMLKEIEHLAAAHGNPVAVFIDTVARNFGDGDENSTKDMTKFVAGLDAIKAQYRCTVIAVHHSGLADKDRARGSIVLKGALDAEFKVSKIGGQEVRQIEATKMKEGPKPTPINFRVLGVPLPDVVDEDGVISNGGYAEPVHDYSNLIKPKGKNQAHMLESLLQLYSRRQAELLAAGGDASEANVKVEDWRIAAGVARNRWGEGVKALQASGSVRIGADGFAVPTALQASEASEMQI